MRRGRAFRPPPRGVATVCLPRTLATDPDALTLALAHEIAHIAHGDLSGLAAERVLGAVLAWHPLARIAAARLDLRREQACDAAVIAAHPAARRAYADLLVRVATRPSFVHTVTASMSVRPTTLRRRVATLLTPVSAHRSPAAPVAAAALALVLSAAAAVPFGSAAPIGSTTGFATPSDTFSVPAAPTDPDAPDVRAGTAADPVLLNRAELYAQSDLRVPMIARQAGISATVDVRVTVGQSGTVTAATIARSDNELFNEPALTVARMARYTVPTTPGQNAVLALRFNATSAPASPSLPVLIPIDPAPTGDTPPDFVAVQRQPVPTSRPEPTFPDPARRDSVEDPRDSARLGPRRRRRRGRAGNARRRDAKRARPLDAEWAALALRHRLRRRRSHGATLMAFLARRAERHPGRSVGDDSGALPARPVSAICIQRERPRMRLADSFRPARRA